MTFNVSSHFRECKYEQELDFSNTQRYLNYRKKKDQCRKKLIRLKKLQKLRLEAEERGEVLDKVCCGYHYCHIKEDENAFHFV